MTLATLNGNWQGGVYSEKRDKVGISCERSQRVKHVGTWEVIGEGTAS